VDPSEESLSRTDRRARAVQILEQYGLLEEYGDLLDKPVTTLRIGQQRILALVRLASRGPKCLLLDEPLRDSADQDESRLVELLLSIKRDRAIVMVTHNQRHAREIGDRVHILTAGTVVASGRCPDFFEAPPNDLARTFVVSGNVWPTNLDNGATTIPAGIVADQSYEGESVQHAATTSVIALPPMGLHWTIQDKLGSMQKPGLLRDLDADLAGLKGLGVRTLVTLTQQSLDLDKLSDCGIHAIHFPIVYMSIPDVSEVTDLCHQISVGLDREDIFVVHCKAGLGRTGPVLACVLVYRGATAVDAIGTIRLKNARFIQTDEQANFVSEFERRLKARKSIVDQRRTIGENVPDST